MKDNKKVKELIEKYLAGSATEKEKNLVDEWYNSIEYTGKVSIDHKQQISALSKNEIQVRIAPTRKAKSYFPWIQAAALVLIIILGTLLFKLSTYNQTGEEMIVVNNGSNAKVVNLPDGSLATLEAHSKITYPKHFLLTERRVYLTEGSVFFDVKHDEKKTFLVATSTGLSVKVLGTSFLVKSFAKQRDILVAVSTGKVAISRKNKTLGLLVRGDQMLFDKQEQTFKLIKNSITKTIPILFKGATIRQVTTRLAYIYNVQIKLDPSIDPELKTTGQFNSSLSINKMLGMICKLHHLKYRASPDKHTYILYK